MLLSLKCCSQSYEANARTVLNSYLQIVHAQGNILLDENVYNSLFASGINRNMVYGNLKENFSISEIDSIEKECQEQAKFFKWDHQIKLAYILPSDSIKTVFDYNNLRIVRRTRGQCFFQKRKEIVVKEADHSNVFLKTTPPIFFADYCLIFISQKTGNTTGSQCLYLFKLNQLEEWKVVKSIACKLM